MQLDKESDDKTTLIYKLVTVYRNTSMSNACAACACVHIHQMCGGMVHIQESPTINSTEHWCLAL